jgi:ATP-binding cassette subfamily C protein EexD
LKKVVVSNKNKEYKDEIKEVLKHFKKTFVHIGIFSFFVNLLVLAAPMYMLAVYDVVMPSKSVDTLLFVTLVAIIFFVGMGLLDYVRNKILIVVSHKMDSLINEKIYNAAFELALKYPGKNTSQPMNDLNKIKAFLSGNAILSFFDIPWFPLYIGIMFLFDPIYGLYGIGATIIIVALTYINSLVTKKHLEHSIKAKMKSDAFFTNQLRNAEVVDAMGMRKSLFKQWMKHYYDFLKANTEAGSKAALYTNLSKTFRMLSSSLMYGVGAMLAIIGSISPGMIIAGAVLLGRALAPISQLTATWKIFVEAKVAYKRLNDLLNEFPEQKQKLSLPEPQGRIDLKGIVTIPPMSQEPVIKNLNMSIMPGECVGLIGPSGSGKTSLAKTILGLWPVAAGKVIIDKAEISQYNKDELGHHIGYLPQDIELFEGSIADNISRFQEADPEEIIEAAKMAEVHDLILKLPNGYETKIGAGGANLSGGQKQRIALARALFKKPKMIILDEPNSNLDDIGEAALLKALIKLKGQSTIIIISHKTNILKIVDKLAVLKEGILSMYGPRNAVLESLSKGK